MSLSAASVSAPRLTSTPNKQTDEAAAQFVDVSFASPSRTKAQRLATNASPRKAPSSGAFVPSQPFNVRQIACTVMYCGSVPRLPRLLPPYLCFFGCMWVIGVTPRAPFLCAPRRVYMCAWSLMCAGCTCLQARRAPVPAALPATVLECAADEGRWGSRAPVYAFPSTTHSPLDFLMLFVWWCARPCAWLCQRECVTARS